jgi:hypothetical protein
VKFKLTESGPTVPEGRIAILHMRDEMLLVERIEKVMFLSLALSDVHVCSPIF